jgi:hypothetical protein
VEISLQKDNSSPWDSFNAYNSDGDRLGSEQFDGNGNGQSVTYVDAKNAHPWSTIKLNANPTGGPANPEVTLDPSVLAAGMSVGQIFGSALGAALGGNSLVGHVVGGAAGSIVGGLIGQKFVQVLAAASLTTDLSTVSLNDVFASQGLSVANAGIGAVSSFLTAELGHALGIRGFDGQLFKAALPPACSASSRPRCRAAASTSRARSRRWTGPRPCPARSTPRSSMSATWSVLTSAMKWCRRRPAKARS